MIDSNPFGADQIVADPGIVVEYMYSTMVDPSITAHGPTRAPFPVKSIEDVPDLIKYIIEHKQTRESVAENHQVVFTTETPDADIEREQITYAVKKRRPAGFDRGGPFQGKVRAYHPILREEKISEDDPDYSTVVLGQQFENMICLSCWASTSWAAEQRALWLEKVVEEYNWYLTMQGLHRFFFIERTEDKVVDVRGNKLYGKPLDFYVKTERLTEVNRKNLEELVISIYTVASE